MKLPFTYVVPFTQNSPTAINTRRASPASIIDCAIIAARENEQHASSTSKQCFGVSPALRATMKLSAGSRKPRDAGVDERIDVAAPEPGIRERSVDRSDEQLGGALTIGEPQASIGPGVREQPLRRVEVRAPRRGVGVARARVDHREHVVVVDDTRREHRAHTGDLHAREVRTGCGAVVGSPSGEVPPEPT